MDLSLVYLITPLILFGIVLASLSLERFSVPMILVALGAGIAARQFGFDAILQDMKLVQELANFALVFIMFHGGLLTDRDDTQLQGWDHVTALVRAQDSSRVRHLLLHAFEDDGVWS